MVIFGWLVLKVGNQFNRRRGRHRGHVELLYCHLETVYQLHYRKGSYVWTGGTGKGWNDVEWNEISVSIAGNGLKLVLSIANGGKPKTTILSRHKMPCCSQHSQIGQGSCQKIYHRNLPWRHHGQHWTQQIFFSIPT